MSLSALFTRSPQRFAEVGPSAESAIPPTYNNAGVGFDIYNVRSKAKPHTSLPSAAIGFMANDPFLLSYASVDIDKSRPEAVAALVSAWAELEEEDYTPLIPPSDMQFTVVNAHAVVRTPVKSLSVSIEV